MPIPRAKRDKIILTGLMTAILLVAIYFLWIGTQWTKWLHIQTEIKRARQQIEKASQVIAEAEKRKFELLRFRQDLEKIEKKLPPRDDPYSWVVKELAAQSDRHNLPHPGIKKSSPLLRINKEDFVGYKASSFNVVLNAGYDEGAELIQDLENEYPLSELTKLEIKPGSVGPLYLSMDFIIEMLGNP